MQIFRSFFKQLYSIFTSSKGYLSFTRLNRWQLLWFCAACSVLLSTIWSAKILRFDLPLVKTNARQAAQEFISHYPDDLVISWNGTQLETTPSKEYTVYYPSFFNGEENGLPYNLATIVPNQVINSDLNTKYKDSLAVITPTQLYIHTTDEVWDTVAIADFIENTSFIFTKQDIEEYSANSPIFSQSFWKQLALATMIIGPSVVFHGILWNGVVQFVLAYIIIIKLYGTKIKSKDLAKLSVPVIVVATFIQLTAELLYGDVALPLFSVGYWLLLFLVLNRFSKRKTK